jgi:virginiamycin B lyase
LLSTIREIPIPAYQHPQQITNGPDGAFWYTAIGTDSNRPGQDFIGRLTLDGHSTEFTVPTLNASPLGIVSGPDNNIWFTESGAAKIGEVISTGFAEYPILSGADPGMITAGPDGALWFTEPDVNRIGRITTNGIITEYAVPTANATPSAIIAGANRELWFTELTGNRIGRISVDGGAISESRIPTNNAQPTSLALALDGTVWFTESNANKYAKVDANSVITEFNTPISGSMPTAITPTADGNLAFVLHGPNDIVRIDRDGNVLEQLPVPTSGADVQGIVGGPSSVVFTEAAAAQIGVVSTSTDPNKAFVQSLYLNVLGRLGTDAELNLWINNALPSGTYFVAAGIEHSPEARERLVTTWYGAYLGRPPVGGEEKAWVNMLLQGNSEEFVLSQILASGEFQLRASSLFPTAGTPQDQFVVALYSLLLRRNAAPSEITFWVRLLPRIGPAGVATGILTSTEYRAKTVTNYYETLLKRTIDPAPVEVAGWVFSSYDISSIRILIESSAEYYLKA